MEFVAVNIAILTISDSRDSTNDASGDLLAERIKADGHNVVARALCKDEATEIAKHFKQWSGDDSIDVIISTGGTGLTGRDVTPEACLSLGGKEITGFGELFRMLSYQKIGTSTIQSRALAVLKDGTYIFALPGSKSACKDAWDDILHFQLDIRHKPCNFVELMPRLKE